MSPTSEIVVAIPCANPSARGGSNAFSWVES